MAEIVYVLTHPAMPGLVKIGRTASEDANIRIGQLYTTGVPVPFDLEFACRVDSADEVERALHVAFGPVRLNPKREFFQIDPEQAIAILRLLHTEEATQELEEQPDLVDQQSRVAGEELRRRRPNFDFEQMGIPVGSVLTAVSTGDTVTVSGRRTVLLQDEQMSLSRATQRVLDLDYQVRPGSHWTYQGRLLREIYDDTYA